MAESPIQNCRSRIRFEFKCPQQWDALQETTEAGVRFCGQCKQRVYLCQSIQEASRHARNGHCVAVPAVLVSPEDSPEERARVEALARAHGVPCVQLHGGELDPDLFRLVPLEFARKYGAIPLRQVGNSLVVAMANPGMPYALDDLKFLTGGDVEVVVASRRDIREMLERAEIAQSAVYNVEMGSLCHEEPEPDAFEGTAGRAIRLMLADAHMKKEEQIQVEHTGSDVVIRYGVAGNRRDFARPLPSVGRELVRQLRRAVSTLPGEEGILHFQTQGERISYEVRFNPTALGEEIILQRLPLR